jgi:phenylalanyl-tRNA synthetase beta chain
MKLPLSWLAEFVELPTEITPAEIEATFIKIGFEVEEVIATGSDLKGPLVVARVENIKELEGLKKPIRYVGLNCGESEIRYVICGARNFEVGDLVVAALPGAVLPGDFAISARETYGHLSNGMICSGRELGISNDHAGIINLPKTVEVGVDAIELLEISDHIFDISVNPDRGYALSIRGAARELAGALGVKFHDPAEQTEPNKYKSDSTNNAGVKVSIDDPTGASDIFIRTIENFNLNSPTPIWMSRRIEKCGMRSISLAVDITNYVMLELGQPLHAFDADKIQGSLHIRRAGKEAKFVTLDEQERLLNPETLVVADDVEPLAIAGVMGGLKSEITSGTSKIALEGAHFNPTAIAINARTQRLSTEASRRLERGVDPKLAAIATSRGIDLMIQLGSAQYVGSNFVESDLAQNPIEFDPKFVSHYLGLEISDSVIAEKLELVGCKIVAGNVWEVTAPTWRPDLTIREELVEEVARLVGYDQIPTRLRIGKGGARLTNFQKRKRNVANFLAARGFTEVYNFPFTNQETLDKLGFTGIRGLGIKIANPISAEYPLYRTHILPGLLETAQRNKNRGMSSLAIFEIGAIARGLLPKNELAGTVLPTNQKPSDAQLAALFASIPDQPVMVAGLVTDSLANSGWWGESEPFDWSAATSLTADLLSQLGLEFEIVKSDFAPWHPGRCAEFRVAGIPVAHAGQLHPKVNQSYGLPEGSIAFGILLSVLPETPVTKATSINNLPATIQDISLFVSPEVTARDIEDALREGAGEMLESIKLFDRYQAPESKEVSLAFTLTFRSPDRTLTSEEVAVFRDQGVDVAARKYGAKLRSADFGKEID